MVYVDYFDYSVKTPKWAQEVVETMGKAHRKAFISMDDLTIFVGKLAEMLDKHKPKGSTAHIEYYPDDEGTGRVTFRPNVMTERHVAYFCFKKVNAVLEYNQKTMDFFDVNNKLT